HVAQPMQLEHRMTFLFQLAQRHGQWAGKHGEPSTLRRLNVLIQFSKRPAEIALLAKPDLAATGERTVSVGAFMRHRMASAGAWDGRDCHEMWTGNYSPPSGGRQLGRCEVDLGHER